MDCPQVAGRLDVSSRPPGSFHPQRAPRAGETTGHAPGPSSEPALLYHTQGSLSPGTLGDAKWSHLSLGHGGVHLSTLAPTALGHKHVGGAADQDSVATSVCSCLSVISHYRRAAWPSSHRASARQHHEMLCIPICVSVYVSVCLSGTHTHTYHRCTHTCAHTCAVSPRGSNSVTTVHALAELRRGTHLSSHSFDLFSSL